MIIGYDPETRTTTILPFPSVTTKPITVKEGRTVHDCRIDVPEFDSLHPMHARELLRALQKAVELVTGLRRAHKHKRPKARTARTRRGRTAAGR